MCARKAFSSSASLPARGRGSKQAMSRTVERENDGRSPARGRGSKTRGAALSWWNKKVAPRAGAWIETPCAATTSTAQPGVAPRAGAWIETDLCRSLVVRPTRRSPRGGVDRNPHRRRGSRAAGWSLPARGRGSKRCPIRASVRSRLSLPARGRGSKPYNTNATAVVGTRRSPRGGVDRNEYRPLALDWNLQSLPARGRGSKRLLRPHPRQPAGRSPRGGVDRNFRSAA